MTASNNEWPVGPAVEGWQPCSPPPHSALSGRYCDVLPFSLDHVPDLYRANARDRQNRIWAYLGYGPFASEDDYREWMGTHCLSTDPLFYTIAGKQEGPAGVASYLRIEPDMGVIEVGHINLAPALQRTRAATEAMYLMMRHVFDELGYRRYEWKCDALNARSRGAAERLGFTFEGVFRQAMVYKGRNRDTAWYSIVDSEWPGIRKAFERWLDSGNFDADGAQLGRLDTRAAASAAPSA